MTKQFKHYPCDGGGKTPSELRRAWPKAKIRNKDSRYATCPECGKLVSMPSGRLDGHNRN
jgi:hypothetical protein